MPLTSLLLLFSPLLLLTFTLCLVMIVAIRRARPEDVPTVIMEFFRLVDRLSRRGQVTGDQVHQAGGRIQAAHSAPLGQGDVR